MYYFWTNVKSSEMFKKLRRECLCWLIIIKKYFAYLFRNKWFSVNIQVAQLNELGIGWVYNKYIYTLYLTYNINRIVGFVFWNTIYSIKNVNNAYTYYVYTSIQITIVQLFFVKIPYDTLQFLRYLLKYVISYY